MDWSPLWISLKTSVTATVITSVVGTFTAWKIARSNGRLKGLWDAVFTLPLVLPPTVVGYVLLMVFGKYTAIGSLLYSIGINVPFTWAATVIASVVVSFPLMYKTARGAFEQIDENLINAARTLGVPDVSLFFRVVLPLSWPGVAAGAVLAFARALGEFGATVMLAGNISKVTTTMPVSIYFLVNNGRTDEALVWVGITIVFSLTIMLIMNMRFDRKRR